MLVPPDDLTVRAYRGQNIKQIHVVICHNVESCPGLQPGRALPGRATASRKRGCLDQRDLASPLLQFQGGNKAANAGANDNAVHEAPVCLASALTEKRSTIRDRLRKAGQIPGITGM